MVGAKGFENFSLKRVGGKENSVSTLIIGEKELKKLREGLLEYCGQDTLAMVMLLEKLRSAV